MDQERDQELSGDLSALAWVQEELRRTLDNAHKSLRRYLRELESAQEQEGRSAPTTALLQARNLIHQAVGALEMIGMPVAARFLRASENAIQHHVLGGGVFNPAVVTTLEQASFGLLDFLRRSLAGKPAPALALFPQYRALMALAGNDRAAPFELWSLPEQALAATAEPATPKPLPPKVRQQIEQSLLEFMRTGDAQAARKMAALFDALARAPIGAGDRIWPLAAAFYEALAAGLLSADLYAKRVGSRLLSHLRELEKGRTDHAHQLAQDLLFFCARAGRDPAKAPLLAAVVARHHLASLAEVDLERSSLGRYDPALIPVARRRVAGLKESWSNLASGEVALLGNISEQAALVTDSVNQLYPDGDKLAVALQRAVDAAVREADVPRPALAMEVATTLLCLDASLDDVDLDQQDLHDRVQRLAHRLDTVTAGHEPEPVEPWVEALYRDISDRQSMGSVVQELRASLAEIETQLDQFNRQPDDTGPLAAVPGQLSSMRGVFSVLGLDQASHAVQRMRDDVASVMGAPADGRAIAQQLADSLGALSFLIDMLAVQPQLARSLFRFDPASGRFTALMGRAKPATPAAPAAEVPPPVVATPAPALAPVPAPVAPPPAVVNAAAPDTDDDLVMPATMPADLDDDALDFELPEVVEPEVSMAFAPSATPPVTAPAPVPQVEPEDDGDAEMREIFIEEAREVVATARDALLVLDRNHQDVESMTSIRRAFHTLKGSSRMVGLKAFGEAAWAMEQLCNAKLAEAVLQADTALRSLVTRALNEFEDWIGRIEQCRVAGQGDDALIAAADALRRRVAGLDELPAAPVSAPSPVAATVAPMPAAAPLPLAGLDLEILPSGGAVLPPADALPAQAVTEPALTLDLQLDEPDLPAMPVLEELPLPDLPADDPAMLADTDISFSWPEPPPSTPAIPEPPLATAHAPAELPEEMAQDSDWMATSMASLEEPEEPSDQPAEADVDFALDLEGFDSAFSADMLEFGADDSEPSGTKGDVASALNELPALVESGAGDPVVPVDEPVAATQPTAPLAEAFDLALDFDADLELQADAEQAEPVLLASETSVTPEQSSEVDPVEIEPPVVESAAPEPEVESPRSNVTTLSPDIERFKVVGSLQIPIALFNIYLNEADEQSRRLCTELAEWQHELDIPASDTAGALAHSLAGNSATVGFKALSDLARRLEHALGRSQARGRGQVAEAQLYLDSAEEIRRLLHQFAAGFLTEVSPELLARFDAHEQEESAQNSRGIPLYDFGHEAAADEQPVAGAARLTLVKSDAQQDLDDLPALDLEFDLGAEPELEALTTPQAEDSHTVALADESDVFSLDLPLLEGGDDAALVGAPAELAALADVVEAPLTSDLVATAPAAPVFEEPPSLDEEVPSPAPLAPEALALPELLEAVAPEVVPVPVAAQLDVPVAAEPVVVAAAAAPVGTPAMVPAMAPAAVDARRRSVSAEVSDAVDAIDPELFEIFAEEGKELLPALAEQLRLWERDMANMGAGVVAMRALHTFKGGARLAGAMRLGDVAHRLETSIEQAIARGVLDGHLLAELQGGVDVLSEEFERLLQGDSAVAELPAVVERPATALSTPVVVSAAPALVEPPAAVQALDVLDAPAVMVVAPFGVDLPVVPVPGEAAAAQVQAPEPSGSVAAGGIDWARVVRSRPTQLAGQAGHTDVLSQGTVRVRAPLLDRMVSQAGEVGISRARIETDLGQMQTSLRELTDNLERLRRQLRDLEIQAETQMTSRMEAARQTHQSFDPLEMDRFTRVQELTRMMAESVNDVGTVQRGLLQTLQDAEDQLANQSRLTRDLQDDLLRARMVEFDTVSDRLYRVVRQAAKESGKQVRLNLMGGSIELDRAVLERMAPPFEHLLRNAVVHGIEGLEAREAAGKDPVGNIEVTLHQSGNEVQIEIRDDGAGLNLARIAEKARAAGLIGEAEQPSEAELAGMIFRSGFTTASVVTELAGRGVGMDVVRAEVTAMGGRIETATTSGQGTVFRLVLPLTTAVTQVVVLGSGELTVAVPSTLVELIRRVPAADIENAYRSGLLRHGDKDIPFFWLGSLLQHSLRGAVEGKTGQVVVVRSASQYVALHVSSVVGNQEAVVKNLGSQLSRLPGLAGMSLLATGATVLIYNPVALAAVYGQDVRRRLIEAVPQDQPRGSVSDQAAVAAAVAAPMETLPPLVMVIDDSLTVRRVTQRLLVREGYRVLLAKDGLDALEKLADEKPLVMLCDIEMPRMDGFDLVRNVRSDPRLADIPVVMITSRIAQKHREHAHELGVDHYLGKPYDEDLLLSLVREYVEAAVAA